MPRIPSDSEMPDDNGLTFAPGIYQVEIQECKNTKKDGSRLLDKTGTEFWNITLSIITKGPVYGKLVFDNIFFTENLISRAKSIFKAFDFPTKDGLNADNPKMMVGRIAYADIIVDDYNGKRQNKVKFFNGYKMMIAGEPDQLDAANAAAEDIPF